MISSILELPREMIAEVIKHADYDGILLFRQLCRTTKELADEEARKISIRRIYFGQTNAKEAALSITVGKNRPPIVLLRCLSDKFKEFTTKHSTRYDIKIPKQDFEGFLRELCFNIEECHIDSIEYNSRDELCVPLFASFLDGLTVTESCLFADAFWGEKWDSAFDTITRLRLNTARMGVHREMEKKHQMADAVDGLILFKNGWRKVENPVSQAIDMLSRRCNRLELEAAWLNEDEVNELIHKLPKLDKNLYLYTRVDKEVAIRRIKIGTMNVLVTQGAFCGEFEIWHDGMRRRAMRDN